MILVDTSVWVGHLRAREPWLERLLERGDVLGHPWVTGELALGNLRRRDEVLTLLRALPQAVVATASEVLTFIDRHALHERGIGYVDAHLLAASMLTASARLWTQDGRLADAAGRFDRRYLPERDRD